MSCGKIWRFVIFPELLYHGGDWNRWTFSAIIGVFNAKDVLKDLKNLQLKQEAVNRASENFWKISALQPSWNFESLELFQAVNCVGQKLEVHWLFQIGLANYISKQFYNSLT